MRWFDDLIGNFLWFIFLSFQMKYSEFFLLCASQIIFRSARSQEKLMKLMWSVRRLGSWLCQTIANIWGDKNLFDRLLNCVEVSRGKIFHVIEQLCCSGEILNIHLKLMKSTQHHQLSKKSKLLQLQKSTLQNLSWGQWMMSWESETIWQYVLIMIGPMGHQNVIFSNKSLTVRQSPQIGWHSEYL